MNELTIFTSADFGTIRTMERDGEPWFCLADVCKPLGLQTSAVKARLRGDGVNTINTADELGRSNRLLFIDEPNLYRAIFQSRKAEAERFMDWVTGEVLPSIRKTGRYEARPMTAAEQLQAQAALLVDMERRTAALEARVDKALVALSQPKEDSWVEDMKKSIAGYCEAAHLSQTTGRGRLYECLDKEANCNTDARLRCLKGRMKKAGWKYKDWYGLTKLDAIALDRRLRVAFEGIVARETARAAAK